MDRKIFPMSVDIENGSSHDHGESSGNGDESRVQEERTNHDKEVRDAIIRKEENDVRRAKTLVVFAIVTCAIIVSVSVYFFAKQNDQNTFELEVSVKKRSNVSSSGP